MNSKFDASHWSYQCVPKKCPLGLLMKHGCILHNAMSKVNGKTKKWKLFNVLIVIIEFDSKIGFSYLNSGFISIQFICWYLQYLQLARVIAINALRLLRCYLLLFTYSKNYKRLCSKKKKSLPCSVHSD